MGKAVDELNTKLTKTEQNKQHQQKYKSTLTIGKKKFTRWTKVQEKHSLEKELQNLKNKKKKKKDSSGFQKTF